MASDPVADLAGRRLLVVGSGGRLGAILVAQAAARGATVVGAAHRPTLPCELAVDTTDPATLEAVFAAARPDVVIDAAAMTDVDGCERDPETAMRVNGVGAGTIARCSAAVGALHLHVGTDFVFGGSGAAPYFERDPLDPVNAYGRSKAAGEVAVRAAAPAAIVARTAWVYGGARKHFPETILRLLATRETIEVVEDERGCPTLVDHLATALLDVVAAPCPGATLHLIGAGEVSRLELARAVASAAGLDPARVRPTTATAFRAAYPASAPRPRDSRLSTAATVGLGFALPAWQDGLTMWATMAGVARAE
jgi:dTDP-4-dehydrorhamnose reductase